MDNYVNINNPLLTMKEKYCREILLITTVTASNIEEKISIFKDILLLVITL